MEAFLKEVEALCKSHGITSFGDMCYNDPDLCKKQKQDYAKYEEDYKKWVARQAEYVKTKPEPYGYGIGWREWRQVMHAAIGSCPYPPGDNLHFDYDKDNSPKPGIWFSSKC